MSGGPAPIRSGHAIRYLLPGVLLACALAAGGLTAVVVKHQRSIGRIFAYDITWDAEQTLVAAVRLELAVSALIPPDGNADPADARLRFDILLSALQTLRQEDMHRLLLAHPEQAATLADFAAAVETAQRLVPTLERPSTARRVVDLLEPLNGRLAYFVAMANAVEAETVVATQAQLARDQWQFTGLLAALVVCGLVLAALLSRRNRLLLRAHGEVHKLAESLRRTGGALFAANQAVQVANA
jgi:uncharacterized membrane protein YciS (DUF1049 family)